MAKLNRIRTTQILVTHVSELNNRARLAQTIYSLQTLGQKT